MSETAHTTSKRFSFGLMRLVAGLDIPDEYTKFPREDHARLLDLFDRALLDTGFFQKTKFASLDISINGVNPDEWEPHEIEYVHFRAKNMLSIAIAFYEEELLPRLAENYFKFHADTICEVLLNVCEKYQLNKEPIEAIAREFGRLERGGSKARSGDVLCSEHEIHVHIKTGALLPNSSEFDSNSNLLKTVDDLLKESGTGSVTGTECGGGYETLFCEGPDANAMYDALSRILSGLPRQSFVELLSKGSRRRIEIQ